MSKAFWQTPIEFLKGVGPSRAELLKKEIGIGCYGDLLVYYPFRYVDRSQFWNVSEVTGLEPQVQIKGVLGHVTEEGPPKKRRLKARFTDDTGQVELVWFRGAKWIKSNLRPGEAYILFGKPNLFRGKVSIPHPELQLARESNSSKPTIEPVYSTTEKLTAKGLNSKGISKIIKALLPSVSNHMEESLSDSIREQLKLIPRTEAFVNIHSPASDAHLKQAKRRLKFEELFFMQLSLLKNKVNQKKNYKGHVFGEVGTFFNRFYNEKLPFELTGAQKRVLKEIRRDTGSGSHMNRLLQGDVGSGKTLVALLSMLIAIDNGFQASLMAPTEILAMQHMETLSELLEGTGVQATLLTGSTPAATRKQIHTGLRSGDIHILVGTHALLEEKVKFSNLGIAVIDEQHRFGVAQRAKFWRKNIVPPHILVMTATPIPRTLAMTLYGDLDVSVIDELPPGRKPVKTVHRTDASRLRVFRFMEEQIAEGRQIYVVYPLIEESSKMDYKNLMHGYEAVCKRFPKPKYQVSIVHGRMKPEDKDFEMNRFASGETQIMVATTVIEVGVNVPNASVMIIESAQRFGLSQLHQLRGRVGRGAAQSYCVLMTDEKIGSEAKERMKTMCATNDGFRIAEVDMRLRGPGNMMGTQQSGILDLRIADLGTDTPVLKAARQYASELLEDDPGLEKPGNEPISRRMSEMEDGKMQWGRIA